MSLTVEFHGNNNMFKTLFFDPSFSLLESTNELEVCQICHVGLAGSY